MKKNPFICPECLLPLKFQGGKLKCLKCQRFFPVKRGIPIILPSVLSENKMNEDKVHSLIGEDNSWYNRQIWYYLIHLSSHIVRFEKEILPKIHGPRVLEIACGNSYASLLTKRKNPRFEIFASDVSFLCLDIQARQMSEIMGVKPDQYVVCDGEKLPFKNDYFDTVFIIASLHHFLDITKVLTEAKRVLRPGGIFLAVDGLMPKLAQKILDDEDSERTKRFGILERKITYHQWMSFLKEAKIPKESLRLYYDPSYLHTYATNPDEEKIIKKSWLFNVAKEIIYGALLSQVNQNLIKQLGLTYIFPAGIVIEYQKP